MKPILAEIVRLDTTIADLRARLVDLRNQHCDALIKINELRQQNIQLRARQR